MTTGEKVTVLPPKAYPIGMRLAVWGLASVSIAAGVLLAIAPQRQTTSLVYEAATHSFPQWGHAVVFITVGLWVILSYLRRLHISGALLFLVAWWSAWCLLVCVSFWSRPASLLFGLLMGFVAFMGYAVSMTIAQYREVE